MKIGIFGGTFNPPHLGHLIVAEHVRQELLLSQILFVPAAIPPHKVNDGIVEAHHRVAMLRLAIQENPQFSLSEREINRGGVSFTVDTLRELQAERPHDQFFLLIGMDNLVDFHTWKEPEEILRLARVVVMTRPGSIESEVPLELRTKVMICPVPDIGIASRDLRKRVSEGKSIRYLTPEPVRNYINRNGLYV